MNGWPYAEKMYEIDHW